MNWDFLIGPGHFGASKSFMMKMMDFKRMIQSSCRVDPCSNHTQYRFFKEQGFFGQLYVRIKNNLEAFASYLPGACNFEELKSFEAMFNGLLEWE